MNTHSYYHSFLNRDRLVHIVDPDPGTCEALSVLLRLEGFQTVFSLDAVSFLSALERRAPDVVVANLDLGSESGLSILRRIKALRSGIPVVMIENSPQVEAAVTAMKLGATDVLTRPIDSERLLTVIRDALRKDVHLGAMQAGSRAVEVRGFGQLTPREREVLQLITNGQSNKEAGRELGISPPHHRSAPRPRHGKTRRPQHRRPHADCADFVAGPQDRSLQWSDRRQEGRETYGRVAR